MKKNLVFFLVVIIAASLIVVGVNISSAKTNVPVGSIIKGKGNPTLYYVGEDGKRYVFPNANTYFSWYDDFTGVQEIALEDLYDLPLGGNVRYKPGALLVKIQTDPKVYAVGENGKLRWIKNETLAKALYGNNWNKLVDDVPDSFFTNYEVDAAIESEDDFDPTSEEEQTPTISQNKGFRALATTTVRNQNQRMCGRLEGALERIQKRYARWGAEITDESNEVLEKCYGIADDLSDNKKVTLCHGATTIEVAKRAAINGHLKHGDTLGECASSGSDDDSSADSDNASSTDDVIDDSSDDSATSTDDVIDDSDTATSSDESVDDSSTEDEDASSTDETI